MSDIYQFNVGGTTYNLANLGLLAPVQITLTADRLYNTGDQFIYTGLLYEATETIAQGTSITIGSNAQLADCVTKQISEINSNLGGLHLKHYDLNFVFNSSADSDEIVISNVPNNYALANAKGVLIVAKPNQIGGIFLMATFNYAKTSIGVRNLAGTLNMTISCDVVVIY